MVRIPALLIFFLFIFTEARTQTFQSPHFTVQQLGEGVFACIAKPGGHAICNAGIIDLGKNSLVIDPFMNPDAAKDLKLAAEALTGKKVKYVVNSHWHDDHIGGNQVFDKARIISTVRTKELIAKNNKQDLAENQKRAPLILESIQKTDTAGMNAFEKEERQLWLGYFGGVVSSANLTKTILPDMTFREKMVLHGKKRDVVLMSLGSSHTESDLFLHIPGEGIAFLGDILFFNYHAWLGDGDADSWKRYLDSIAKMNLQTLVPGHGPVCNPENIAAFKGYLELIRNTAVSCHEKGIKPENEEHFQLPQPYDHWHLTRFFKPNVIGEHERLFGRNPK